VAFVGGFLSALSGQKVDSSLPSGHLLSLTQLHKRERR
jgi:hypothetical protein